jgi:hypothetical protein
MSLRIPGMNSQEQNPDAGGFETDAADAGANGPLSGGSSGGMSGLGSAGDASADDAPNPMAAASSRDDDPDLLGDEPESGNLLAQLSGSGGGFGSADAAPTAAAPSSGKGINGSVALLLGVVVVAGGTLFALRQFGMKGALDSVAVDIDYPLEDGGYELISQEHARLMENLEAGDDVVQVPLSGVQMNPFEWDDTVPAASAPGETEAERLAREEAERLKREIESRQRTIETALSSLKINSVMGGARPIARISGEFVRENDILQDMFLVVEIRTRSVVLEDEFGVQYELFSE